MWQRCPPPLPPDFLTQSFEAGRAQAPTRRVPFPCPPRPGGASLGDRPWREGLLGPKPLFGTDFGALILPVFRGRPPRLQGILEHSTFLPAPSACSPLLPEGLADGEIQTLGKNTDSGDKAGVTHEAPVFIGSRDINNHCSLTVILQN